MEDLASVVLSSGKIILDFLFKNLEINKTNNISLVYLLCIICSVEAFRPVLTSCLNPLPGNETAINSWP